MNIRLFLSIVFSAAPLAFSQATAPATSAAPSHSALAKPIGPEAIAAQDPTRVVAVVDGKDITAKQALDLLKPFPADQRKQYEKNLSNLVQQIYLQQQLAGEAVKMNLDQQPLTKDRIAMARETVLAQAYINHLTDEANKAPSEDPKHYYDTHPDEFDQARLSGIFVAYNPPGTPASAGGPAKTEQDAQAKANDIEKKLKAGGDFSSLARTDNDNPNVASKGGDLGTVAIGDPKLPAELRTAIGKLQPGQFSEPIKVSGSYLIVRLDSRKKLAYSDVQSELTQRLNSEKSQSVIKQEVEKYKLTVKDPDFFDAPSARTIPTLQRPISAPAQPSPEK